jgi:hypothetical protein
MLEEDREIDLDPTCIKIIEKFYEDSQKSTPHKPK